MSTSPSNESDRSLTADWRRRLFRHAALGFLHFAPGVALGAHFILLEYDNAIAFSWGSSSLLILFLAFVLPFLALLGVATLCHYQIERRALSGPRRWIALLAAWSVMAIASVYVSLRAPSGSLPLTGMDLVNGIAQVWLYSLLFIALPWTLMCDVALRAAWPRLVRVWGAPKIAVHGVIAALAAVAICLSSFALAYWREILDLLARNSLTRSDWVLRSIRTFGKASPDEFRCELRFTLNRVTLTSACGTTDGFYTLRSGRIRTSGLETAPFASICQPDVVEICIAALADASLVEEGSELELHEGAGRYVLRYEREGSHTPALSPVRLPDWILYQLTGNRRWPY